VNERFNRRQFVCGSAGLVAGGMAASTRPAHAAPEIACTFQNRLVSLSIADDGTVLRLADKRGGKNCSKAGAPFARLKKGGNTHHASAVTFADGRITVRFGDSGAEVVMAVRTLERYFVFEVISVSGKDVEELTFVDVPLTLKGTPEEPLACCALALNLKTNVREFPQPNSRLTATCYARFGFVGAQAAIVACPPDELRQVIQEAVTAAPELPHSPIGGPWALGQPINSGSYLFNFGNMTIEKADDWIKLVKNLGMNQIDFHGGGSFRFGDCMPNPKTYPDGFDSLKAVVDKLHAAGISAGLHTYAFFIAKTCPWVTPVPDPRLAKDATFTLGGELSAKADVVPVVESTAEMSTITGFSVRNSVTLQIDDELITYSGINKEQPYTFTGCRRGACGTKVSAHKAGAKVHHLKECFGLFVPDPHTSLFEEVARATAGAFNRCGFDMMYLDALDGSDILGGRENAWHYGSQFVFDIWKHLKKPALMEMSTFHHHLWYVRSRYCAWDHPNRAHKKFIDIHCRANETSRRMFMPGELGWWALKNWSGAQTEPTFADDIEYLMCKCLGTDTGFALMGINPDNVSGVPALPRLAQIIKRYEDLRHSQKVPEAVKAKLRVLGDEYTLIGNLDQGWRFQPVDYAKHKVTGTDDHTSKWQVVNKFAAQPVRLRIEALMAAGPFDAPDNVILSDFASTDGFSVRSAASGVSAKLEPATDQLKVGPTSARYTAMNSGSSPVGAWSKMEMQFEPPKNLGGHQALGVWVHGDGQGEVLNLQLKSPAHLSHGIGDHYIPIDFTGWRYFELIEPEGQRYANYKWPYGGLYSIYRESVRFNAIDRLGLWYNNLPPGKEVTCYLSPIRAVPLVESKLINPAVTIGSKTITFQTEIASGSYLEFNSTSDCKLYGPQGQLIREVTCQGDAPLLTAGQSEASLHADTSSGLRARANVTLISSGQTFS
jgi:hypothetical protein